MAKPTHKGRITEPATIAELPVPERIEIPQRQVNFGPAVEKMKNQIGQLVWDCAVLQQQLEEASEERDAYKKAVDDLASRVQILEEDERTEQDGD